MQLCLILSEVHSVASTFPIVIYTWFFLGEMRIGRQYLDLEDHLSHRRYKIGHKNFKLRKNPSL